MVLGRSWAVLGPSWGVLGRVLGGLGAILGGVGAGLGDLIVPSSHLIILSYYLLVFSSYHRMLVVSFYDMAVVSYHRIIVLSCLVLCLVLPYIILSYLITLSSCRVVAASPYIIIVLSSYHVIVSCYPRRIALSHDRQREGKKKEQDKQIDTYASLHVARFPFLLGKVSVMEVAATATRTMLSPQNPS